MSTVTSEGAATRAATLKALKTVSMKRQGAERRADELRVETDELILEAHAQGIGKARIAEVSGMTRQTIYTVLRKAGVEV